MTEVELKLGNFQGLRKDLQACYALYNHDIGHNNFITFNLVFHISKQPTHLSICTIYFSHLISFFHSFIPNVFFPFPRSFMHKRKRTNACICRVLSRSWKSLRLPTNFHDTSNLLDTSMVWKFVGSQLPTFWTLPWYGNLLEVNFQPFGHFHGMEICWKSNFQPFGHFHGMEICWKSTSNLLDTSMVWKFVGSQLPTFWTLPWYGNLLEVNFQPFGHFHGMEICWKSTSNLLDTSMVWKFVGSQLPTFWTLPWYGNLLEVNFQPFGHFHGMEICWKSTSNLLDTSMVWKFVGSQLPTFWTLPWYGNLLEVNFQPFGHFHGMEICWKSTSNLLDTSMVWKFVGSPSNLLDTSMVWKFVGSQLPTFWTLPWYGNLLEVNFQPFGHFHGMEICWKSTSNLLGMEICWKSTSNLLDTSMVWKFVGSRNDFHDLERTRF